jgi:anti-sigma regulatory factor (Ser/Thr protein kinase)
VCACRLIGIPERATGSTVKTGLGPDDARSLPFYIRKCSPQGQRKSKNCQLKDELKRIRPVTSLPKRATKMLLTDPHTTTAHQAVLTFPSQEVSVPGSRHFTEDQLRRWGVAEDERDSAVLVVDELAANAVQHGHADLTVSLALEENLLVITVTDSGPEVTHEDPRSEMPADEHGRGTWIVEFLALWTEIHDSDEGRQARVGIHVTAAA